MGPTNKPLLASIVSVIVLVMSVSAQDSRPKFEVASIKPSPPGNGMSIGYRAGRFSARNTTLKSLIINAFNVHNFQVEGGPGWMDSDRFDIDAKLPEGTSGRQGAEMLQNLLMDRFQLQLHRQTRDMPIYLLVVAKNGPKLAPTTEDKRSMIRGSGRGKMDFQKVSMPTLALNLAANLDRIVLDKTGLTGDFDFKLEWNPDLDTGDPDLSKPSMFTALQEQLGLKLDSARGPVEVLVVDSVSKPTEN